MPVATIEELSIALKKTLGKKGMGEEDVLKTAKFLVTFFGFHEEVLDNHLRTQDRDIFYMLEEEGLLTTRTEEVHLKKGKLWRIHYWVLKVDQVKRLAYAVEEEPKKKDIGAVYDKIDDSVWKRENEEEQ